MSLIDYTVYGKIDKVELAITNLKMMAPVETGRSDKPYYVAYSGGKDSDVIRILCELAGVKHELWHNHTTADAPETVRYVRSIPGINISMPDTSMWQLIVKKKMPPTRLVCNYFKNKADVVEVTHGKWKAGHYEGGILDGTDFEECSVCQFQRLFEDVTFKTTYSYCPNCGARMDIEKE